MRIYAGYQQLFSSEIKNTVGIILVVLKSKINSNLILIQIFFETESIQIFS